MPAADLFRRIVPWAAWSAAILSVVLLALRLVDAASFSEPLMTMTSGGEEEAVFGIWKQIRGQIVYTDPTRIPFAASYYNWLFYAFFGETIGLVLGALDLGDAWIPTVGHIVALALSAFGAAIAYWALRQPEKDAFDPLAAATAIFLFLGPLTGFFALSLHPEVAATALSIASIAAFLRLYPRRPACAVAAAAALSYLAWAFKQTHLFAAAAIGLLLLIRMDWRWLALFVLMHVVAIGATIGLGTSAFRNALFFVNTETDFAGWQLRRNILNFAYKATPEFAMFIVAFLELRRSKFKLRRDDSRLLLAWLGLIVTGIPSVVASAKTGAAENYFFLFAFFLFYVGFARPAPIAAAPDATRLAILPAVGWVASAAALCSVIFGFTGTISLRPGHVKLLQQKACLAGQPRPIFSSIQYLELPWVKGEGPHFIPAYNYKRDRESGRDFEAGGIGGLIADRRFATIAVPVGTSMVDGRRLHSYALKQEDCAGMSIYARGDTASPDGTVRQD